MDMISLADIFLVELIGIDKFSSMVDSEQLDKLILNFVE